MTASKLTKWLPKCLRPAARRATPRTALALQTLEAREVPALYTWVGPANGGLWNDTNNWNTPNALGFPNAFDTSVSVVFNGAVNSIQNVDLNLSVDRITFNGPSGTIQLNENLTLDGDAPGDQLLVTGVGAYSITGTADLVLGGVNSNPFVEVPNGSSLSVFADMTGTKGITKQGAGALVLRGTNTFTGDSVVQAGILGLNGGAGNAIPAGTKTTVGGFGVPADIRLDAAAQIANDAVIELDTNGRLNFNSAGNDGVGEIILDGGELSLGTGVVQTSTITVVSNSSITGTVSGTDVGRIVTPAGGMTVTVNPVATLTVTAQLAGSGGITYEGAGTTRYENPNNTGTVGVNAYTGLTWVKEGTLVLADDASNAAFAGDLRVGDGTGAAGTAVVRLDRVTEIPDSAAVTVMSDGLLDLNDKGDAIGALTVHGGGQVTTATATLTLTGDVTVIAGAVPAAITGNVNLGVGPRTITVTDGAAASDLVLDGVLSGGNLVKAGPGTLELKGLNGSPNTHGTTSVNDGVLVLNDNGFSEAIPGTLFIGDGTGLPGSAVVRYAQSTEIGDTVGVAVLADGLLDLNDRNGIIGGLVMAGGEVRTGTGTLTVTGNITASASPATSFINGRLSLGNAVRTVDGPGTMWVNARVANGGLVMNGTGTLRLFGDNIYTGDTVVNAGTLSIHGSQPGSNVVVNGGVLSVTGAAGTVTTTAGVLSPGESDPAEGATKDLTLAGATYLVDVYGPATADRLDVTGAVNLTGATLDATRFVTGIATTPATGEAFTIIANDGADAVTGAFAGLAEGATVVSNGRTLQISYAGGDGNDVVLTDVTPTPAPAVTADTYAVGAGQAGGNTVRVYNPDGSLKVEVPAFEGNVSGGVRTATADVNGDGVADLVVGTGPGTVAEVRVFDGSTGQRLSTTLPFADFQGGVFVAAADFNNDGFDDIVITPDEGGGPRVSIYSG
ncbi:MAG TPA: autotransporter-associated beta strand repeat-containing protein, partial [Urbifossiella sp.]|nr:autotransporter-associated beta strand repeat-containing protein [Urbifossiella sp.]